jgi:hypothetical protein
LGATVSVDLCHRSGLEYLSLEFQTQDTVAARAGLRVRPESTRVPRPWISDPRYGCHRSGLEGATKSTCVPGPWISDPKYGARVLRVPGPMVQSVKTTCS